MRSREDIRAARRYMHVRLFRECNVGLFCWACAWRTITGAHERERRRFIEDADRISGTIPTTTWRLSDGRRVSALERGIQRQNLAMGGETCPELHDGERCATCRAAV